MDKQEKVEVCMCVMCWRKDVGGGGTGRALLPISHRLYPRIPDFVYTHILFLCTVANLNASMKKRHRKKERQNKNGQPLPVIIAPPRASPVKAS